VIYHDLPLCRGEFKNGPTDRDKFIVRLALVGQILTGLSWATLFGWVVYFAVFTNCPTQNADDLSHCKFLIPGLTEAIVIFIVFLNNSMTIKEYKDRAWVYPIICREELLYLSHIITKQEARVLDSFSQFHGLGETDEVGLMDSAEFNVGFNYFLLMCFDLASLASVSTLIMVHNATPLQTFFRALPFAIILVVDISSETMILVYHDLPLLRADHEEPKKNKVIFDVARCMQVFVNFAWLGALIYMVWVLANLNCVAECTCANVCSPFDSNCNDSVVLSCIDLAGNDSVQLINADPNLDYQNCTVTWSIRNCQKSNPSLNSCILLFLVLLDGFYQMGQMFFRSYIYPLTVPEYVMFLAYWRKDKNEIVKAIKRSQFGDSHVDVNRDPLLDDDENQVPLEG